MKKFLLVLSVLTVIGASSCKKSYTCTCINNNTLATSTVSVKASNATDAVSACAAQTEGGTATCGY